MVDTTESDRKEEGIRQLKDILKNSTDIGQVLAKTGRNWIAVGQEIAELARVTSEVLNVYEPPWSNIKALSTSWTNSNKYVDGVLTGNDLSGLDSTTGTAVVETSLAFDSYTIEHSMDSSSWAKAQPTVRKLQDVIDGIADKDDVIRLMNTLGLSIQRPHRKSALDLFMTAHAAFENPVLSDDPISTSLLPMRESINTALSELLRRRPEQEQTSKPDEKIRSVLRQVKKDSLSSSVIEQLADEWGELSNRLSSCKQATLTRDQWRSEMMICTVFLRTFLGAIDIKLLRG